MSPEDLYERDLECGDLAVHEDSCQVELHLETHVHLGERATVGTIIYTIILHKFANADRQTVCVRKRQVAILA